MDSDGIDSFFTQLGINSETDVVVIMVAMYMEANYMGEFTWVEFEKGCKALGCDSIESWTAVIPRLRQEMKNDAAFLRLYKFAFLFAQEKGGLKNVKVDLACGLWDLLVGPAKCPFIEQWKAFIKAKMDSGAILVVTKDTWD